jgi:hypothetical protein
VRTTAQNLICNKIFNQKLAQPDRRTQLTGHLDYATVPLSFSNEKCVEFSHGSKTRAKIRGDAMRGDA